MTFSCLSARAPSLVGVLFFVIVGLLACAGLLMNFFSADPLNKFSENCSGYKTILDRYGKVIAKIADGELNCFVDLRLDSFPSLLERAVVFSEDRRFWRHAGVDLRGKARAIVRNLSKLSLIEGGSTISEQLVRLTYKPERGVLARLKQGLLAARLEFFRSKKEILRDYLNQAPAAGAQRGVESGARYLFGRSVWSLSAAEILSLAVVLKSPSRYKSVSSSDKLRAATARLALEMFGEGFLSLYQFRQVVLSLNDLKIKDRKQSQVDKDFFHFLRSWQEKFVGNVVLTTLDSQLQNFVRRLLAQRLRSLSNSQIQNAAALVVDFKHAEVLAWINGHDFFGGADGDQYDAVLIPRQAGSTLKPFLYCLAFENGFTPSDLIEDSPLSVGVGSGVHNFRNYSRRFYGLVTLSEGLGSSLNIPAIRLLKFIGLDSFYFRLKALSFSTLSESGDFYGEGLALGNAEVTLFDLVRAYTALANRGKMIHPKVFPEEAKERFFAKEVFLEKSARLVTSVLSDGNARSLEFGRNGLLSFPYLTAVKTGTSNDFNDLWAIGYNGRFVVGVWFGNLNRKPTRGETSSSVAALALRGIFDKLSRRYPIEPPLRDPDYLSPIVAVSDRESLDDNRIFEYSPKVIFPTPGLKVAYDPRVPLSLQKMRFRITTACVAQKVEWFLDDREIAVGAESSLLWQIEKGDHSVQAVVECVGGDKLKSNKINFKVI
ncbi:MAG TPA: transglycosylase domain-containing protein [Oligoflexia bacterium]|nr:transglycosylase domain-containing protein [Oligoflexia bacterium]HMP27940.1 transglycosylase domain-containing protein [Oligoflexia bacterium]